MSETWLLENLESIGVAGILLVVAFGLYKLWRESEDRSRKCEASRIEDAERRGELKQEIGELGGEVKAIKETLEVQRQERVDLMRALSGLHKNQLEGLGQNDR